MAITTGSFLDRERNSIPEILNRTMGDTLPTIDPIFSKMIAGGMDVIPPDQIGRDFLIKRRMRSSYTGVFENADASGNFNFQGDLTTGVSDRFFTQQAIQTFPTAVGESPNPKTYNFACPMRAFLGSVEWSKGELQVEALPSALKDAIDKLVRFGRHGSHQVCTMFYVSQNSFYKLFGSATAPSSAADANNTGSYIITMSPDNLAFGRVWTGMGVDIYDYTGATRRNEVGGVRVPVWVLSSDGFGAAGVGAPSVKLSTRTNPTGWDSSISSNTGSTSDIYVFRNQKGTSSFTGIAGYASYIKTGQGSNDNVILGGEAESGESVDVTVHTEHKSLLKAINGVLTESILKQVLRCWIAEKSRYGYDIDTLVMRHGTLSAYEDQKLPMEVRQRTGMVQNLGDEGSDGELVVTIDGRKYTFSMSDYLPSGEVFGHKFGGGNWRKITPPSPSGSKTVAQMEEFAPFRTVASILTGNQSDRIPVWRTNVPGYTGQARLTGVTEMPVECIMQLVPHQFCGLRLTGCTEANIFGD